MNKTIWQKIYSALGFWHYYIYNPVNSKKYKVIYWCCLPFGKFFRKFDILKIPMRQ